MCGDTCMETVMVPEIVSRQLQPCVSLEELISRAAEHVQDETSPLTLSKVYYHMHGLTNFHY